jgi:hypothetical protein
VQAGKASETGYFQGARRNNSLPAGFRGNQIASGKSRFSKPDGFSCSGPSAHRNTGAPQRRGEVEDAHASSPAPALRPVAGRRYFTPSGAPAPLLETLRVSRAPFLRNVALRSIAGRKCFTPIGVYAPAVPAVALRTRRCSSSVPRTFGARALDVPSVALRTIAHRKPRERQAPVAPCGAPAPIAMQASFATLEATARGSGLIGETSAREPPAEYAISSVSLLSEAAAL